MSSNLYAPYEELKIDLKKNTNQNKCAYKDRDSIPLQSNKCINSSEDKISTYLLDSSKVDSCKLIYNNRIENNIISNKQNSQLNPRPINTIPYKNYSNFVYNPELEVYISSGLQTSNRKSISNTSEVEGVQQPMIKYVKNKIESKNNNFDISRFQLASRQIKGNKKYIKQYKKKINQMNMLE